ncbi:MULTISPECIES: group II truncated hemoglobin [Shewanella]|jgi:hemoglobin|uniref:group II truncated hemoglobin n=1 Tax=Shewanella TaxID=22 RepID=UPI000579BA79|nr:MULTISPECIES: group II truncated hemoglobin [Shewanella]OIN12033.1 globin [Shewanella algae]MCE9793670.1 group II truncated hemoglobin [Shewanella indica]MCL1163104.1 group II truncated hemoglobin [Shewanella chilikensis]NDO76267.1 group II truncated hemoglobin [Shewanella sp. SE1]QWL02736.1 group II truncated hemoglobin [Shewanella indica]
MNWLKKILNRKPEAERDPTQSNAYDLIGGDETIRAIAKSFYQQMQTRPDTQELLSIHQAPLAQSEQKLYEFLSGWLGGPQLYQAKYGHPALRARHMPFAVDERMRDQWLLCMRASLEANLKDPEHRKVIFNAIAQLADHMRNQ